MFEFCICDGANTVFCPFHDLEILKNGVGTNEVVEPNPSGQVE